MKERKLRKKFREIQELRNLLLQVKIEVVELP